jgi:hypothetical protein
VIQLDHSKLAQGVNNPQELFSGSVFLPVTDLDALLSVFEQKIGKPEASGDGVLKIGGVHKPSYVKQVGHWAYLADKPEFLATAPPDPSELIAELGGQYDLAVRLNVGNVPDAVRNELLAGLKTAAEADLQRRPGEAEEEYIARKILGQSLVRSVTGVLNDLEQVTFGWAIDHENENAYIDATVSVKPGTPSARHFAALSESTTRFGGFLHPEATVAWNWAAKLPAVDTSNLATLIDVIRTKALDDLDRQGNTTAARELGKKLINGILDVVQKTVETSRVDGGLSVVLDPDAVTVVTGGYVADGPRLQETLETLVEAVRMDNPAFAAKAIKMDAAEQDGVRIHTVSVPVPYEAEDREKIVRMIGENVDVAIGVGDEAVYVAAGRESMNALRKIIQNSKKEDATVVPPLRISVAVGALADFMAKVGEGQDRAQAAVAAALLEGAAGSDHVNIVASAVDRGLRFRLEFEQGILEAVGKAAQQKRQAKGP